MRGASTVRASFDARWTCLLATAALAACGGAADDLPTPPAAMSGATDAGAGAAMCPPTGAQDDRVGAVVPNVILEDCAGNTVQLHDLCGKRASWFYLYAGW